jgi:hypothetical protein
VISAILVNIHDFGLILGKVNEQTDELFQDEQED